MLSVENLLHEWQIIIHNLFVTGFCFIFMEGGFLLKNSQKNKDVYWRKNEIIQRSN